MKIASNTKLITRNQKIGRYTTLAAIAVLGIGLYISISTPDAFSWSLGAMLLGFFLSQFGMSYSSKFGKSPRPDESIVASLKGLEDKYTVYLYNSPTNYLVVGPAGVWVLLPYYIGGTITYNADKKRWKQKGGSTFMKFFGQESLGRPDLEADYGIKDVRNFLQKNLPETDLPEVKAALIFYNTKVNLDVEEAPLPAMMGEKVKDFFRKRAKESSVPQDMVTLIQKTLPPGE